MSNLFLVLMIAFVGLVLFIVCLAIGWLITGKKYIETQKNTVHETSDRASTSGLKTSSSSSHSL